MRIIIGSALAASALMLAGCQGGGINRDRPDEFAVTRGTPLVVPPDYALAPPKPGSPVAQGADARTQALQALFGGPAPRSAAEQQMLREAGSGTSTEGARSTAGDPNTNVVDKGAVTQTIIAAPEGPGRDASVTTPQ
jgi:hypothetical protein